EVARPTELIASLLPPVARRTREVCLVQAPRSRQRGCGSSAAIGGWSQHVGKDLLRASAWAVVKSLQRRRRIRINDRKRQSAVTEERSRERPAFHQRVRSFSG